MLHRRPLIESSVFSYLSPCYFALNRRLLSGFQSAIVTRATSRTTEKDQRQKKYVNKDTKFEFIYVFHSLFQFIRQN